jgi:hypothetical protein
LGAHWFTLELIRIRQRDAWPGGFMSVAFFLIERIELRALPELGIGDARSIRMAERL